MTIINLETAKLLKEYKKELSLFNKVCDVPGGNCLRCKSLLVETLFCEKCFTWWQIDELENYKSYDEYLKDNLKRAK